MKCEKCGEEHETLYLTCHSPTCDKRSGTSKTRAYIVRNHGEILAICAHCDGLLATWPDASQSGLDWTVEKPN